MRMFSFLWPTDAFFGVQKDVLSSQKFRQLESSFWIAATLLRSELRSVALFEVRLAVECDGRSWEAKLSLIRLLNLLELAIVSFISVSFISVESTR